MKATQQLHDLSQSLWLDNITHGLLTIGTLRRSSSPPNLYAKAPGRLTSPRRT